MEACKTTYSGYAQERLEVKKCFTAEQCSSHGYKVDELAKKCVDASECTGYTLQDGTCVTAAECVSGNDKYLLEEPVRRCLTYDECVSTEVYYADRTHHRCVLGDKC